MSYTQVYRSGTTRALGAVTVVVCAAGLATLALRGVERELLRFGWPLAIFSWLAWAAYWRPHVTLDETGLTLHNVLRTVRVPWSSVVEIHSRYGLRVETPQGSYAAWAVAAPVGRERLRGGDTEASLMVRQRLERIRGLGDLPTDASAAEPQVTWDMVPLVGAALLLVLGLGALTVAVA